MHTRSRAVITCQHFLTEIRLIEAWLRCPVGGGNGGAQTRTFQRSIDGPSDRTSRWARAIFAPAVLAGRAGKVPAAGQLASHTVSAARAFRDRLAKSKWRARPPAMAGRGMHNQEVKMVKGTDRQPRR